MGFELYLLRNPQEVLLNCDGIMFKVVALALFVDNTMLFFFTQRNRNGSFSSLQKCSVLSTV